MATLLELQGLFFDNDLLRKVQAALIVSAYGILQETTGTNLAARQSWAKSVFNNTNNEAQRVLKYILGKNSAATTTQILSATDVTINSQVTEFISKEVGA